MIINSSNLPKPFRSGEYLDHKIKRLVEKNPRKENNRGNCSGYNIWNLCWDNMTVAEYHNVIQAKFDRSDPQFDKTKHLRHDITEGFVVLVPPTSSDIFIADDIREITLDKSIDETVRATLINARIGQGQFRQCLVDFWGGCAVTGYSEISLLVASHIKPWACSSNHERLDMYNGLLLAPNIDKAFDKGYITFSDAGDILISPQLKSPDVLGISSSMHIALAEAHKPYLRFHRENVYKR